MVIGDEPQLRDPALGPLSTTERASPERRARPRPVRAGGNIVPGLAERWNVSDDGLSYIFRIAATKWPNGRDITADQVARVLKRYLAARSKDPLKDSLGSVEDVVAMTDRVIEIRSIAPRPNLLPLLAQPEFAILRDGQGTGPFRLDGRPKAPGSCAREISGTDEEVKRTDAGPALGRGGSRGDRRFRQGQGDLVLGGTFLDLPFVRRVKLPRNELRFDPASGLFGLVPVRSGSGRLADADLRKLSTRQSTGTRWSTAFGVPNLAPRTTLFEPGLDGMPPFPRPTGLRPRCPNACRDSRAGERCSASAPAGHRPVLPEGPGADLLLRQLQHDWGAIGFTVQRAPGPPSPLRADRRGRAIVVARLVRPPLPLRRCTGLRSQTRTN